MNRLVPTSLTGRLVATVVLLVALVAVLVSVVTTVAMRSYLDDKLDSQVDETLGRAVGPGRGGLPPIPLDGSTEGYRNGGGRDGDGDRPLGQRDRTVTAVFDSPYGTDRGEVLTTSGGRKALGSRALATLEDVPADGRSHDVDLPGLGDYRVEARRTDSGLVVAGLPTSDRNGILASLLGMELLLGALGVILAGLSGRYLVHRQLRPLREVAATAHQVTGLPLATGAIGTTVRVPDDLTDERTEVGQVGAALNTMLEHVERALDERHRSELQVRQFVADASHELRTPLTTIHGYAELSRRTRPADPEQLALAMSKVEAEATRMSSLVEDLLLLARLDAGRPLARDDVDLTKLVLETVQDARVVGREHRWGLDLPDAPIVVPGDEQRLHQVVTNLTNNARRHTPPGTTVTVGAHREGDEVVLTVTDDGPGLPPELVHTAFERFTRGDSSRTRESGGAGLGLSLVQAIAVAHHGRVSVESRPGTTRFEVCLPGGDGLVPAHR